jgi:regulator of protease activity HflC (stomatin/prohibitin superfamily)
MTASMRIDLDSEALDLGGLPRFRQAALHARRLSLLAAIFGGSALLLWTGAFFLNDSMWRSLLLSVGAATLLTVTAMLSARRVACWRATAISPVGVEDVTRVASGSRLRRVFAAISNSSRSIYRRVAQRIGADIGMALVVGALAVLALLAIRMGWNWQLPTGALGMPGQLAGAGALLLAFGLLVIERYLTSHTETEWPESLRLAQFLRLVIALLLIAALCLFFASDNNVWPARLIVLMSALPAAIAVELALRALLALFQPRNERVEPAFLANSLLVSLLAWPPRPVHLLHNELFSRFGIDLRQSWAFAFMRRASLPVFGAIALVGWLLTGVHEIAVDGRGIYERFGRPIDVWKPGLHAGLPWPFGRVRAVEYGAVHELAATLTVEASNPNESAVQETSDAEGPPPRSANRLWDASHVAEKSQVIASASGGQQNFQIINMDVRFIYRIAADDASALAATYNSADLLSLMRSSANRLLVQYFASRTLDGVLGAGRAEMAKDIGEAVQADLNKLATGVEILATMVESIHPPAGAANAYHAVQAAQIFSQASISRERGRAAEEINTAKMRATSASDRATASARETKAAAEAVQLRFAAEREAYRTAGKAFVTELYLSQLSRGLADAQLVVLDHRIGGGIAPTIDLRRFGNATLPLETKD